MALNSSPSSSPTALEWLASLPDELQTDIAASYSVLDSPLRALRLALDSSPLTADNNDIASTLNLYITPLAKLLLAFEASPLSVEWSCSMTKGDDDPILRQINNLRMWLLLERSKYPSSTKAISCCRVIHAVQLDSSAAHLWQTLFGLFSLAKPPSSSAITTIQTPLRISSGGQVWIGTTHFIIDPALKHELNHLIFIDTPGFHDTYFPRQAAAFTACRPFLRAADSTWEEWPPSAEQNAVARWFSDLTTVLLDQAAVDRNYYTSADRPVTGTTSVRKTDMLLYPTTRGRRYPKGAGNTGREWTFNFAEVLVVGELKCAPDEDAKRDTVVQLAGYVRLMFYAQQRRRFVHAFTLTGDWMRCYIFHRGGGFTSRRFSVNAEPERFVDVVLGYATMTMDQLGYDTTLEFDKFCFRVDGCEDVFAIKRGAFFNRQSIASRGTTCWEVTKRGDKVANYVLRDTWRNSLYVSEASLFKRAIDAGVQGLVEVVAFPEVTIDGKPDDICGAIMKGLAVTGKPLELYTPPKPPTPAPETLKTASPSILLITGFPPSSSSDASSSRPPSSRTRAANARAASPSSTKRKYSNSTPTTTTTTTPAPPKRLRVPTTATPPPAVFNRIHTRILMRKGRELHTFTSPRELILALHDAIAAHRSLYQTAGILHRDISIYNIMLTASGRGFLIDLDMAAVAGTAPSGALHRTGTMEFMAIEVLRGVAAHHTYRHDLESFWYVLVWICVYKDWREGGRVTPLSRWAAGDMETAADCKRRNVVRGDADGYQTVERAFHPECAALRGVADRYRRFLFPLMAEDGEARVKLDEWVDVDWAYDTVLGILKDAAEELL